MFSLLFFLVNYLFCKNKTSFHPFNGIHLADKGDDNLPESLEDGTSRNRSIPQTPVGGSPSEGFATKRKKLEVGLYNMTVVLAAVAAGFDIRISNTVAIHPNLHGTVGEEERAKGKRDSFIFNRRDAYLAAVRDSFIEPENDFRTYQYPLSAGYWHTYHGVQARQRPSLNVDGSPLVPGEQGEENISSGGFHGFNARTTSHRSSFADSESSVISSNPATEKTVIFNRQVSESSNYETPTATRPSQNPQRRSVTFEDDFNPPDYKDYKQTYTHKRTPSNASNSSSHGVSDYEAWYHQGGEHFRPMDYATPVQPVPPRRRGTGDAPQRPTTLDIGGSRTGPIQLKYPSPSPYNRNARYTPPSGPVDIVNSNHDNTPYFSTRSHLSPGNTPPHIMHQKTLLDIDVEGQSQDSTQPLVTHRPHPSAVDLEKEFLH